MIPTERPWASSNTTHVRLSSEPWRLTRALVTGLLYTCLVVCGALLLDSIIGAHTFTDDGTCVVKLRNNWGKFEWNGKFSDLDSESWTDGRKAAVGFHAKDDGVFYLTVRMGVRCC